MAVNAPPQYFRVEQEFRKAQTLQEQVDCLERMLVLLPKHKASEKVQADLKTRLKDAKEALQVERSAPKKVKSFRFPRQGAGAVSILGGPNSGKSRLLAELTKAQPEVAPYPFTTREPLPGMMAFEDIAVQLIDTPPVTDTVFEAYLPNIVRTADAALLCFDGSSDDAPEETLTVIHQFADRSTVLGAASGFVDEDFAKVQIRTLLVVTHASDPQLADRLEFYEEMNPPALERVLVDFETGLGVAELPSAIYRLLGVMRIYTKVPGKPVERNSPFTLPIGSSVEALAERIHNDLAASLKFAKVWGSGLHDGQSVGKDHILAEQDVVELHTA
jgi:uncharacterized protein